MQQRGLSQGWNGWCEMWEEARARLQRLRQCVGAMRARGLTRGLARWAEFAMGAATQAAVVAGLVSRDDDAAASLELVRLMHGLRRWRLWRLWPRGLQRHALRSWR